MELVATTRLGYSYKDIRHAYLCDFINKYRTYKSLFNFEKIGHYDLDFKPEIASLRDM